MDMRTVFPSRFFRPEDFDGTGKVYTIGNVIMEQVAAEFKPVMYFRGIEKGLVLNQTNSKILMSLPGFGAESNQWVGKEIVLYSFTAVQNGQPQQRLGVREHKGGSVPVAAPTPIRQYNQAAQDEMNDQVPF